MLIEIAIVLLLAAFTGVLAMSELATVSARAGQLKAMARQSSGGGATALDLAPDPGRFLGRRIDRMLLVPQTSSAAA